MARLSWSLFPVSYSYQHFWMAFQSQQSWQTATTDCSKRFSASITTFYLCSSCWRCRSEWYRERRRRSSVKTKVHWANMDDRVCYLGSSRVLYNCRCSHTLAGTLWDCPLDIPHRCRRLCPVLPSTSLCNLQYVNRHTISSIRIKQVRLLFWHHSQKRCDRRKSHTPLESPSGGRS